MAYLGHLVWKWSGGGPREDPSGKGVSKAENEDAGMKLSRLS